MLHQIGESGEFYELLKLPHRQNYDHWIKKFPPSSLDNIKNYLDSQIATLDKFSVGTHFGGDWHGTPLQNIYITCKKDPLQASFLIGRIVLEMLITSSEPWLCTKTNLQDRDFATNFYWRK